MTTYLTISGNKTLGSSGTKSSGKHDLSGTKSAKRNVEGYKKSNFRLWELDAAGSNPVARTRKQPTAFVVGCFLICGGGLEPTSIRQSGGLSFHPGSTGWTPLFSFPAGMKMYIESCRPDQNPPVFQGKRVGFSFEMFGFFGWTEF